MRFGLFARFFNFVIVETQLIIILLSIQVQVFGLNCSSIPFKAAKYVTSIEQLTGTWFELSIFGDSKSSVCESLTYTSIGKNLVNVDAYRTTNENVAIKSGFARIAEPGVMELSLTVQLVNKTLTKNDFWNILDTDYNNYLTAFSCSDGTPEVAILLRSVHPSQAIWDKAFASESANHLPPWYRDLNCVSQKN